jgi:hypothetical protein
MSADKSKSSKKLPRNYVQILDWLLAGKSLREIADLMFRDKRVVQRIVDSPEFQAMYKDTLRELHGELKNTVAGAGRDAFRFLADLVRDSSISKVERQRAAMFLAEKQIAFLEAGAKAQTEEDQELIPDWSKRNE